MAKSNDADVLQEQEVAYYAASLEAWFTTSLEYDRSIFTLSAGGMGVLVTLLTTKGVASLPVLVLYILAILSFLCTLLVLLKIFRGNGDHILAILQKKDDPGDKKLRRLDKIAMSAFAIGVVFSGVLGIVTAYDAYIDKEETVANDKKNEGVPTFDSLEGAKNLQPKALAQKSYEKAGSLQPKALNQQSQSTAGQQNSSQSTRTTPTSDVKSSK